MADYKFPIAKATVNSTGGGGITEAQVIVQVDEVPATVTADSPSFIQTPDGTLYRKYNKIVDLGTPVVTYEYVELQFVVQEGGYYKPVTIYEAAVSPDSMIVTTTSGTQLYVNKIFTSYIGPTDVESLIEGLKNCFFMAILTFNIEGSGGGAYIYECYPWANNVRVVNGAAYVPVRLPNDPTLADDANSHVQIGVMFKNNA